MAIRLQVGVLLVLLPFAFSGRIIELPISDQRAAGDPHEDHLITDLPGAPDVPFSMYSGYITVDETHGRALFYWFVEAEGGAASAPLTLWLNGGPGCSSVGGGMLSELGPFFPGKKGQNLVPNPYSWNKVSNMIFLESPAGVGFSYSNTTLDYTTGDARTALDAYHFLLRFFKRYPHLSENGFYITGESYAGHYVPQLADVIVQKNKEGTNAPINLKGIAVGNAWTDAHIDNHGAAFFWWTHAIISDTTFYGIADTCNFSVIGPLASDGNDRCDMYCDMAFKEMGDINIYDIYVDVCLPSAAIANMKHLAKQLAQTGAPSLSTSPLLSTEYDPCVDNEVEAYLNHPDVQLALHANVTCLPYRWTDCSSVLNYSRADLLSSVLPEYRRLLAAGLEVLVYSGDVDAIVPVTGSRDWISKLLLPLKAPWRPWIHDNQVGGYVTEYEGLTFATVRQAGHMVPYTRPARAVHLFESFINRRPL